VLGAGASTPAIPNMKSLKVAIDKEIINEKQDVVDAYNAVCEKNLEKLLSILYAQKFYLEHTEKEGDALATLKELLTYIENYIFSAINVNFSEAVPKNVLEIYQEFYQRVTLRNKDLSRTCIFTTNNDLFNEKALDFLNFNFNNGFGGGITKVFNPARFRYTYSTRVDPNMEKFEPLENMVHLYKLHGSINWAEREGNSLFDIQEIEIEEGGAKDVSDNLLIYPTPMKQNQSLGAPYADLIREFQSKLGLPNSVLFVIGYSFSDEHLNNIIYQSLSSNPSLSIIIFGDHPNMPLSKMKDSRIYRVFGSDKSGNKIHYFEYIVDHLLPITDEDKERKLLEDFVTQLKQLKTK
jgi:hypothetical protein